MLPSLVLAALAAVPFVSAANDTICSTSIFASLGCLTSNRGAASVCAQAPHSTLTLTVTTTTLDVNSVTVTRHAPTQVTVQSTTTQMSTKTVTSGRLTTVTSISTHLSTKNTTVTTYVPTHTSGAGLFPPLCIPPRAVSALGSLHNDTLATACSCIGHRIPTSTVTSTVTAKPVQVTSTDVHGTAPTTTIYQIVVATTTITERPATFVTNHVTSCSTSTVLETRAAPTFTQVYGPKAGCADKAPGRSEKLGRRFMNLDSATKECQRICEQDSGCEFVYVQRFFCKEEGSPYYGCVLNEQHLDVETDLECGKKAGVYGVAVGFDAHDRGTESLS